MKVLMISTDRKIFEDRSGVRQRITEYGLLVKELHIIVFSKKSQSKAGQPLAEKIKISENIWAYPTNSMSRWFYIFDAIKIGKKIVFGDNDWLVTAQDPFESGIVGRCITKSRKIKLQLQIHTDFLSPYFTKDSISNKIRVKIAKSLLPKADCIRVVSKRIRDSLLTTYNLQPTTITILPIFVNARAIQNTSVGVDLHKLYPQFETIILMVSRLEKEKNIFLALSAFKQVFKKYPKTGLVIIGEGSQLGVLKKYIHSHSLEDNVMFEGNSGDTFSFYKTADIFLHTSNYEGYSMVLVEASALGCPIVTTDVGIANESFEDGKNAFICKVGDRGCLIEKTVKLIKNKNLRDQFASSAREATYGCIKEKTKEEYLAKYKYIWEKCLNQ